MYERFTNRARKVMQLANEEAQRFNHEYIGTEHILLGLIKEGSGVAANALKSLDIDLRKIRVEVERIVQAGPDMVSMGKLPQTPRAKRVVEFASDEARTLNHDYVGTEHLLLGLIREEEGVAAQVLLNLGIKLENVRQEVARTLGINIAAPLLHEKLRYPPPPEDTYADFADWPDRALRALKELDAEIKDLQGAKEQAIAGQDFDEAALLREKATDLLHKRERLLRDWQKHRAVRAYEWDVYVGLDLAGGSRLDAERLTEVRSRLKTQFGGVAELHVRIEGSWKAGDAVLQGNVRLLRFFSKDRAEALASLRQLKEEMSAKLGQQNILIVGRNVELI